MKTVHFWKASCKSNQKSNVSICPVSYMHIIQEKVMNVPLGECPLFTNRHHHRHHQLYACSCGSQTCSNDGFLPKPRFFPRLAVSNFHKCTLRNSNSQ